ncbi:hypothetical protein pdam_00022978, partial [Pocillopora damicornis]
MLIGSQFKLSQINSDFTVKVNNTPLERVIEHKTLGVQIDESLSWRPRIHTISKKISTGIAILRRLAVTMYKKHNNLSPSYLRWIFTNTSNVHSHNLRNSELNYYVPRPRTESAKGSLHYRGSVLWKRIPSEIKKLPSLNVFKTSFHEKDFSDTP